MELELAQKIQRLEKDVAYLKRLEAGGVWTDWVPTVTYAGGTTDPTATSFNYARYSVIGDVVFYMISWEIDTLGSGDRTIVYFSYPVTKAHVGGVGSGIGDIVTGGWVAVRCLMNSNSTIAAVLSAAMGSAGALYLNGFYRK
jgi:hypothetical protein